MALGWRKQYFRYKNFSLNISLLYKRREDFRMFLEIIFSFVAIIVFSLFVLQPTVITIAQLVKDIKTRENTLNQLNEKITALSKAQGLYEQEKNNIPLIDYAVPDEPAPQSLIRQIELLAGQNSVTVLNFAVNKLTLIGSQSPPALLTTEGLSNFPSESGSVSFSLTVSGEFSSLSAFEKGLENLRRPIKMDMVKFFSVNTETGSSQNMTINGRSPFLLTK